MIDNGDVGVGHDSRGEVRDHELFDSHEHFFFLSVNSPFRLHDCQYGRRKASRQMHLLNPVPPSLAAFSLEHLTRSSSSSM